jgi:hypothetical protein
VLYVIKADLDTGDMVCWFNPDLGLLEQDQTGLSVTRTNDFITTLDKINYRTGSNTNTYSWSNSKLYMNGDSPFGYVAEPAPPLLINGSFELPCTDKIHGFNGENPSDGAYGENEGNPLPAGPDTDVPGWQTDSESVDSGVQLGSDFNGSTDGDWVAFMRSSNPALWQLTDHVIEADDVIVFSVDASLNWNGNTLQITIYYDDDGTRVPIASVDQVVQDDWQTFTLTSDVSAVPEAIGKKLGVEINHSGVADPAYDGWMMFDNAVLEVFGLDTATTVSIPVENFSFELPGDEKHENWDLVPSWSSDPGTEKSGVEDPGNWKQTDGIVNAMHMQLDPPVYNLLTYVIEAGDVLTLSVDAFDEWKSTQFEISLYYDDAGVRVPLVSGVFDVTGDYQTFSVTVDIDDVPEAIGHQLGVQLRNVTPIDDMSWVGMDNVRVTKEL